MNNRIVNYLIHFFMKILQINVFNYRKGGSEAVYFSTMELLKQHGNEVVNFALKWPENYPSTYEKYFPESKEARTGLLKPIKNIINYFYDSEAAKKMEQLIKTEHPDLAHVHLIWGQITGSILPVLKRHGIPIIFSIHDYRIVCPAYTFRNGKGKICEQCKGRYFYHCITNKCTKGSYALSTMMAMEQYFRNLFFNPRKYIDGLIYVSKFAKQMHEKYMPELKDKKNIVLYNLADRIGSVPCKKTEKYFLFFGRLSYEKGVKTLITAFKNMPQSKLKIAGTGPLENELKDYTKANNISNVEFLGYKSGNELTELVENAYFIVVPSEWYENNPMTIVEGYATGVPVIGSHIGGIPEIIVEGKTGYLFNPGDANELENIIKACESLSEEQYEDLQKNALEFAKNNFDKDKYYPKLIDFYKQFIR